MKNMIIASLAILSTSAIAGNEMYALGGFASDDGDLGGQFTFGSQIAESNWHVESTMIFVNIKDTVKDLEQRSEFESDYFTMTLAPMYKHNFNESFSIYGKLGAAYIHSDSKLKYTKDGETSKTTHSDNQWGVTYGFGAEFKSPTPMFGNSKFVARAGLDWFDYSSGFGTKFGTGATAGLQAGFTF